jgi:hypothetical protein
VAKLVPVPCLDMADFVGIKSNYICTIFD